MLYHSLIEHVKNTCFMVPSKEIKVEVFHQTTHKNYKGKKKSARMKMRMIKNTKKEPF